MKILDLNNLPQTDADVEQYLPPHAISYYTIRRMQDRTILQAMQDTFEVIADVHGFNIPKTEAINQYIDNQDAFEFGTMMPSFITFDDFCHMILFSRLFLNSAQRDTATGLMRYAINVYMGFQSKGGTLIKKEDAHPNETPGNDDVVKNQDASLDEDEDEIDRHAQELIHMLREAFQGADVTVIDRRNRKNPTSSFFDGLRKNSRE